MTNKTHTAVVVILVLVVAGFTGGAFTYAQMHDTETAEISIVGPTPAETTMTETPTETTTDIPTPTPTPPPTSTATETNTPMKDVCQAGDKVVYKVYGGKFDIRNGPDIINFSNYSNDKPGNQIFATNFTSAEPIDNVVVYHGKSENQQVTIPFGGATSGRIAPDDYAQGNDHINSLVFTCSGSE